MTSLSVYRQVVDFSGTVPASYVVPGGASGIPGSAHYPDQLEAWRTHHRVPMLWRRDELEAACTERQQLEPA
jgi:penicillin amidase